MMNETEKISSAADVEWQRYEYVNENPKGTATKRRLTLVRKVTKVGEMFVYFKTLLETFPAHQHCANWQSTQMEVSLYVVLLEVLLFMSNSLIRHSK
jgi:hypothetical protein